MFYVNLIFAIVFIIECALKLLGDGPRWYFLSWWNIFDFVVVCLSIITIAIDIFTRVYDCAAAKATDAAADDPFVSFLGSLRVIRLARVFRLIRRSRGLQQMIRTLLISLPSLVDIMVLIFIIMVIFSVLGTTFFYNVNTAQDPYGFLDDSYVNYGTFFSTMGLLFRHTTGEAWNGMMYYTSTEDPYLACKKAYGEYLSDGCASQFFGRAMHLSWTILATYMLMQLFTAVILENFDELQQADKAALPRYKLDEFVDAWTELDPEAEQKISTSQLEELVIALPPPLGVKLENGAPPAGAHSKVSLLRVIKDLEIPILPGAKISYQDTFKACVRRVLADADEVQDENLNDDGGGTGEEFADDEDSGIAYFRGRPPTAAEDYAARSVQQAYREFREKRLQVLKGVRRTTFIHLNTDPSDINTY